MISFALIVNFVDFVDYEFFHISVARIIIP
jgi:hypothetical protein